MDKEELRAMITDYMAKGFLDNIIDMFRSDESLFEFIPSMISDVNIRVRLGAAALVESLAKEKQQQLSGIIPALAELMKSPEPRLRGDAAHIMSFIKHPDSLQHLEEGLNDADPQVRQVIEEAVKEF
ncbi:MAG: HEAT repeat domain-containing protein [Nitrospiraceae bacterium]|nr:HEAT repeat domain-containing protein [Nitrospiraceae bacterium]